MILIDDFTDFINYGHTKMKDYCLCLLFCLFCLSFFVYINMFVPGCFNLCVPSL